jgi:hypothetical protein
MKSLGILLCVMALAPFGISCSGPSAASQRKLSARAAIELLKDEPGDIFEVELEYDAWNIGIRNGQQGADYLIDPVSRKVSRAPRKIVHLDPDHSPFPAGVAKPTVADLSAKDTLALFAGYPGLIYEAEIKSGVWDVKILDGKTESVYSVNPLTREVTKRKVVTLAGVHPLEGTREQTPGVQHLKAAEVVDRCSGLPGDLIEVEFEHGRWNVALRKGSEGIKYEIDPTTGKMTRDDARVTYPDEAMVFPLDLKEGVPFIGAKAVLQAFSFSDIEPDNFEYKHGVWSVKVNEPKKQTVYILDSLNRTLIRHRVKEKK